MLASLACADDGEGDGDSDSTASTGAPVLNPVDLAVDCIAGSCMTFVP